NCALGLAQMMRLEEILKKREAVASSYRERLGCCPGLVLPPARLRGGRIRWFVYVVRVALVSDRDGIVRGMTEAGIGCGRYFAPIHLQPGYAGWRDLGDLAVTVAEAQRTIALPFFNNLGTVSMK